MKQSGLLVREENGNNTEGTCAETLTNNEDKKCIKRLNCVLPEYLSFQFSDKAQAASQCSQKAYSRAQTNWATL
uniref:Uncharacterized protein n=1 Tax=Oryza brachyantha TaxID=4533 RepID=J3MGA2_ORYBR